MFELRMMCKPNHLGKVLSLIDGLIYDLKVVPVKGVDIKRGKATGKFTGASDAVRALMKDAAASGKMVIGRAELAAEFKKQTGMPATAMGTGIKTLITQGAVSRTGHGQYTIVRPEKL